MRISPPRSGRKALLVVFSLLLGLGSACNDGTSSSGSTPAPGGSSANLIPLSSEDAALAKWEPASPPNVILILVDTLRADAVLDPEGKFATPSIDRLGADGVVFQSVFSHAPMTLPSHSSLFSSRPPLETGVRNNWQEVPESLPLLADWMKGHGYQTRAVISLGTLNPPGKLPGISRGFESYDIDYWSMARAENTAERLEKTLAARSKKPLFLFAHFADPHEPYNAHGKPEKWADLRLDGEDFRKVKTSDMTQWEGEVELEHGTHAFEFDANYLFRIRSFECFLGDEALEVDWKDSEPMKRLKRHRLEVTVPGAGDGPVRVRLRYWVNDVPWGDAKSQRYAQEVAYVDRSIGRFLDSLRSTGLYDGSLILFTSDHGETLGERDDFYGHVEYLTDEEIHVPLLIKLPADDPRGPLLAHSLERLVSHADVTPTILDLVGLPGLPGQRGTSLLTPHVTVHLAETHTPEAKKSQIALRDERYKMIYEIDAGTFVMYDLDADPGETTNVYPTTERERPDWAARLQALGSGGSAMPGEEDAERRAELEKLGYGGGD